MNEKTYLFQMRWRSLLIYEIASSSSIPFIVVFFFFLSTFFLTGAILRLT